MESSSSSSSSSIQIPTWHLKADYVETCNCDYGCPCNFDSIPTYGFCIALVLYHIREGNYGDIKLDGLDVVGAYSWSKAIHEGNGTIQLYITKNALKDNSVRDALVDVFSGKAKGEGPFALFAGTFKYFLEPQFVDINVKVDGKKSSFSVSNIMDEYYEYELAISFCQKLDDFTIYHN
jgi:hypothetical protein